MPAEDSVKTYGLTPALRARIMAFALIGIAVLLLVITVVIALMRIDGVVMLIVVVLVPIAITTLAILLSRGSYVLKLDSVGYRTRFVGGVGAKRARWAEVLDLAVVTIDGARCAQFRLRDGRRTTIAVDLLQTDPEELIRELKRRLTAAS